MNPYCNPRGIDVLYPFPLHEGGDAAHRLADFEQHATTAYCEIVKMLLHCRGGMMWVSSPKEDDHALTPHHQYRLGNHRVTEHGREFRTS